MARRPVTTAADKKDETERPKRRAEHHADLLIGLANQRKHSLAMLDDGDAYTIEEFCRKHRISVQLFYKYPELMPDSFYVASRRLISRESAARWRAEREAATASEVT
jgi:hypothetical protein